MMLTHKNTVTRKAIDTDSGNKETFVLALILLLIHCMTQRKSPALFLPWYPFAVYTGWVERSYSVGYIYMHPGSNIVVG